MPRFTKGFSPFIYRGESAALVNRLKNGNPVLAAYFGEKMADYFLQFKEAAEGDFLLLPLPLSEERKRERGYNQAEELAYFLRKELNKAGVKTEYRADVLQKRKDTLPQKQMRAGERAKNVEGAYHVHLRTACRGKTVLLVDDIITTGATGSECAARLLAAGAKKVYFLCAASLPEQK
jgi:ComF family protein